MRADRRPRAVVAALVAGALASAAGHAVAATYKWVDEKGVVHYSDKMPPDAVNRGSTELSKEGIPLRRTDPTLTPEQRKARETDTERARVEAKKRDEAERRDRALLASYTTEDEIDQARRRALATIDEALVSAKAYTEQLVRRRDDAEAKRKALGAKPVPPALEREFEAVAAESAKQEMLIGQKRAERDAVIARYDADRARWRELKGRAGNPAAEPPRGEPPKAPAAK